MDDITPLRPARIHRIIRAERPGQKNDGRRLDVDTPARRAALEAHTARIRSALSKARTAGLMVIAILCGGCSVYQRSITTADSHSEETAIHWGTAGHYAGTLPGPKDAAGKVFEARAADHRTGQDTTAQVVISEVSGVAKVWLLITGLVDIVKAAAGFQATTTTPGGSVRTIGPVAPAGGAP